MVVFSRGKGAYLIEDPKGDAYVVDIKRDAVYKVDSIDQVLRFGYCEPIESPEADLINELLTRIKNRPEEGQEA